MIYIDNNNDNNDNYNDDKWHFGKNFAKKLIKDIS